MKRTTKEGGTCHAERFRRLRCSLTISTKTSRSTFCRDGEELSDATQLSKYYQERPIPAFK